LLKTLEGTGQKGHGAANKETNLRRLKGWGGVGILSKSLTLKEVVPPVLGVVRKGTTPSFQKKGTKRGGRGNLESFFVSMSLSGEGTPSRMKE